MQMSMLVVPSVLAAGSLHAQSADSSARPGVQQRIPVRRDTVPRPPLSPGKAFLYSFLVPGYSQVALERPTALVVFAGVEVVSWNMLRRSLIDLRHARRFSRDSVPAEYQIDPSTGLVVRDPDTGEPLVTRYEENPYPAGLVAARRTHVEDWATIIVFNHLLAGVDALVASHLWGIDTQLGVRATPRGGMLTGSIKW